MSLKNEVTPAIKPGDDFFNYVNKRWLDENPIPADKAQFGAMDVLTDDNLAKLKQLLEAPVQADENMMVRLVKQYYQSAMDEDAIAKTTPKFVETLVKDIQKLADPKSLTNYIALQHGQGQQFVWELIIEPDDKDSSRYLTRFWQGGLGLPERTYYLEENPRFEKIRQQYHTYLIKLFTLIGLDNAEERAKNVYNLEVALAKASLPAADTRDPIKNYNHHTTKQLTANYPEIDWPQYLKGIGLATDSDINVAQIDFMEEASRLIASAPIEQWQDYLTFHVIASLGSKLSQPYEDLNFEFFGKVLSGKEQLEPRHVRISRQCMANLPEPIGRLYVEHYFDESAKAEIKDLVDHLQAAFEIRIGKLDWMTEETKQQARHKLSTFLPLLGYPEEWKSFEGLELGDVYVKNYLFASKFEWGFEVAKFNKPVDKTEWLMSPALVNAYYWPNSNGITFPAGILQPPFFDAKGDFAANYGAIGAVIGHELTHGFDDSGSQFDADGNMKVWWQESDRNDFEARAEKLVKQYQGYELTGRHVDGKLTLGENIADLGGLLIAYDALQHKLAELGQRDEIDGYTPEQRFFLNYASTWRRKTRDELAIDRLVSDPHSPEIYRVNGVVPNMDEFYEAFEIKPEDKLYIAPDQRVRIW